MSTTRYLIFLTSLIAVEGVLVWGLETAIRILISDEDQAKIYRWAVRIMTIQIAHYATCAFIFWDMSVVYPMLIPVLTVVTMMLVIFLRKRKQKKTEYLKGPPEIPDVLASFRRLDDNEMILALRNTDSQRKLFFFSEDEDEKRIFIEKATGPEDEGDLIICERLGEDRHKEIGRLIPVIHDYEYMVRFEELRSAGYMNVSIFDDIGLIEIHLNNKRLFRIAADNREEGTYSVFYESKGERIWEKLLRSS